MSAGTLRVGNGGTTGPLGTGAVDNNGALVVQPQRCADGRQPDQRRGAGSRRAATGTVILTGTNTYSGGTTISSGGDVAGGSRRDDGNVGHGGGDQRRGAVVQSHYDCADGGHGHQRHRHADAGGTNVLSLSGTNSYSGVTTISIGDVAVGAVAQRGRWGRAAGDQRRDAAAQSDGTLTWRRTSSARARWRTRPRAR